MEVREGYKQTEVGIIPDNWDVKKIKKVCELINGRGFKPHEWKKEGLPIIRIQNLNGSDEYNYYQGKYNNKIEVEKGQLLFAWSGSRGTSFGPHIWKGTNGLINYHTWKVKIDESIIYKGYFFHSLKLLTKKIEEKAHGASALVHIQKWEMEGFEIPLPSTKAEQTAIATALSDADALISGLEKLIDKKRDIKQGAMQQLLTGQKRLPGFSGEWEIKELKEIVVQFIVPMRDKPKIFRGNIPWCRIEDFEGKYLLDSKSKQYVDDEVINLMNLKIYPKETLLVSCSADLGRCAIVKRSLITNQTFIGLVINENTACNEFFYYYMTFNAKKLNNLSSGTTISYLSRDQFETFKVKIPPTKTEQTAIGQILSDMDAEIEALEQKLAKYRMLKQGMMQELLTGSIRLLNTETSEKPKALVKAMSEKNDSQKKKHNWAFNEAVVISVLSKTFGALDYPLGRKRYTKFSYLLHRYAERNAEGYLKKAAGPYNPDTRYKGPEKIAQNRGYIKAHSSGNYSGYIADDNIDEAVAYFNKWYGMETLQWLEQFRYKDNDQLELLTTVDMAVQDLLQNNQEVSIVSVKALIQSYDEWRAKLKRTIFSDNNINAAIRLSEDLFGY